MRVLYKDDNVTHFSEDFPDPDLRPGDRLVYRTPCRTLKGEQYEIGDCLYLISRTNEAPHKRTSTRGNWLVRGKDGQLTIWSNIEWMASKGYIVVDNSHKPGFDHYVEPLPRRLMR